MALHRHKPTTRGTIGVQPISPGRGKGLVRRPVKVTTGRKKTTLLRKVG